MYATEEMRKSVSEYVKSISKDTGINFYSEIEKQTDDCNEKFPLPTR